MHCSLSVSLWASPKRHTRSMTGDVVFELWVVGGFATSGSLWALFAFLCPLPRLAPILIKKATENLMNSFMNE